MSENEITDLELNSTNAIAYIKLQWDDIHHSRLQEWSAFGVIAGILYATVNIQSIEPKIFLAMLGFASSTIGALISWQHLLIFREKIKVISNIERRLQIFYPPRPTLFPVQALLYLLFGGIAGGFITLTTYFISELPHYAQFETYSMIFGGMVFFTFFIFALSEQLRRRRKITKAYDDPYLAESSKLKQCLELLKDKPLKLIADGIWASEKYKEIPWNKSIWEFHMTDNKIVKPILMVTDDSFQFSLANAASSQTWHYHANVYEIYISNKIMEIEYISHTRDSIKRKKKVINGVLIVPPGLKHKITLTDTTYVFQASISMKGVGADKVIIENI